MAAYALETPNEKAISGAAALIMHALFIALLVFGVNLQKREPPVMVAELWSNLPPVAAPRADPPPPPPKAQPRPPPPPKVEPKPVPKAEPKPQPRADIDLREKKEKERKAREQAAAEKKKREEQEKKAEALKKQQAADAEAKRREQEQAEALKKQDQLQAAAQANEIEKYRRAIADHIRHFIVEPPNIQGNPESVLDIVILPGGEVLDVRTTKASGQAAWDNACERAIRRAQPLPLPSDPALMKVFRELSHLCRYKE